MTDLFIKVKTHQEQQLPFVLYAKPNSDRMVGLFQKNDHLYFLEDYAAKGFVFAPFDGDLIPFVPQKQSDVYVEKIILTDYVVANTISQEIDETAKIVFENLVQRGIEAIVKGTFEKVVLSRKEEVLLRQFDLETVFKKLIAFYPTAFKYCFFHPKIGLWMGATPEQFLKINRRALQTVALAGTQIATNAENVIWPQKETEEQRLVTEFITTNLQDKVSEMTVSSPYSVKAGNLWHIKTDISATAKSKKAIANIISALHPTSAVCGLPKETAKDFILKNENYEREYYSGFLGELNIDLTTFRTEQSDLFVNLRCMKIVGDTAVLFIGCGITKDSVPEDEFRETVNKSMTMRKSIV
ncbi:isochorismate synthase [Flavobacterium sp. J49]|uniref:isochorismate synthase n=1 Tax=Flavobacterium sp. J49 TaxID=2718534 RepID=UPI0015935936|nr:isochorismate synthase [Flavobacterium sp. J49]MBF6642301.1 isochorismate synthase [Flavobacterium sp. J49]NIC03547.1 isochorismate synthase [Flavobacterium sp. J49]